MAFAQQNYQQKLSTKQELDHTIGKFPWTIGWIGTPLHNLSVDLHHLVNTHFEPMKQSSFKHSNMKTVFLLGQKSIFNTSKTGKKCHYTPLQAFFLCFIVLSIKANKNIKTKMAF